MQLPGAMVLKFATSQILRVYLEYISEKNTNNGGHIYEIFLDASIF